MRPGREKAQGFQGGPLGQRIETLLVESGAITPEQRDAILKSQDRMEHREARRGQRRSLPGDSLG